MRIGTGYGKSAQSSPYVKIFRSCLLSSRIIPHVELIETLLMYFFAENADRDFGVDNDDDDGDIDDGDMMAMIMLI